MREDDEETEDDAAVELQLGQVFPLCRFINLRTFLLDAVF